LLLAKIREFFVDEIFEEDFNEFDVKGLLGFVFKVEAMAEADENLVTCFDEGGEEAFF
jgi:hypothetical protein